MLRRLLISSLPCRHKRSLNYRHIRKAHKDKNLYAISRTGESPPNPWLTKERLQLIAREYEKLRNLHRHTIKYNKKLIDEFSTQAEEYSDYVTHKQFAYHLEWRLAEEAAYEVRNELQTLPKHLQDEIEQDEDDVPPLQMNYIYKYQPQMSRILPPRMADNWRIMAIIGEIQRKTPDEAGSEEGTDDEEFD
jgi:hypothetical protein